MVLIKKITAHQKCCYFHNFLVFAVAFTCHGTVAATAAAGGSTFGLVRAASALFPISHFAGSHVEADFDIFAFGRGDNRALAGHAVRGLALIVFRIVAAASHWLAPLE